MEIFKVTIKNFGKLTDAVVRIGKFTVFAGPNNTGKSFACKALCSIFGATNANRYSISAIDLHVKMVGINSRKIAAEIDRQNKIGESLQRLDSAVEKLQASVRGISIREYEDELSAVEDAFPQMCQHLDEIKGIYDKIKPHLEEFKKSDDSDFAVAGAARSLVFHAEYLLSMREREPLQYIMNGIQKHIKINFRGNFQVGDLSRLCGSNGAEAFFGIEGVGGITLRNSVIDADFSPSGFRVMRQYSEAFYMASPVFWPLKNALESVRRYHPRQVHDVPKYFRDMAFAIGRTYTPGIDFSKVLGDINAQIGGRIVIDSAGNLIFQEEGGGNYPLEQTAMGIANFGMLGLVIERNMLDKNTFLVIDEPEAHLHPAWQVAMAKVLIHLAKRGVKVVMATHSADILKWLEIYVKENPEEEGLFALNHFTDGTVKSGDFHNGLAYILDDLTTPYQHMFIRGLRA